MAIVHTRIARAVPKAGHDVHVYNLGDSGLVMLMLDTSIVWQEPRSTFADARETGLHLAAVYDCEMVEHHPFANRETA